MWFVGVYGAALLILAGALILLFRSQRHQEATVGVVADTLNKIHADVLEGRDELLGKIDELSSRDTLDAADREALEALRATAAEFANIVPNAVTSPLPDPVEAPAVDGDEPVVNPDTPVDEPAGAVEPVDPAPATGDAGVADDEPDDAPVTETPADVTPEDPTTEP